MLGRGTFDKQDKVLPGIYIKLRQKNSRVNNQPYVGTPIAWVDGDTLVIQFRNSEDMVYVSEDTLVFDLTDMAISPTVDRGVLTL